MCPPSLYFTSLHLVSLPTSFDLVILSFKLFLLFNPTNEFQLLLPLQMARYLQPDNLQIGPLCAGVCVWVGVYVGVCY